MSITINGSGTITGISSGGLPDGVITTDDLANNAVTAAKIGTTEQSRLCAAWVNFNGTGTVAIRASYNVSSITDNGTGDYTVNFTTALVDTNYAVIATAEPSTVSGVGATNYTIIGTNDPNPFARTTASAAIKTAYITTLAGASTPWDSQGTHVAIFR